MKRVGIFSGTFDPVHNGHIRFALAAAEKCELDKVFFLVEPRPRRKQGVRALEHRINMVQLAIEEEPKLGVVVLAQSRFSVLETLPPLKSRFEGAQLYMLVGDDVVSHMADWPHVGQLARGVRFIIGGRALKDIKEHIAAVNKIRGLNFAYDLLTTEKSAVSSSKLRGSIRRGHRPREIHPEVYAYIVLNGLYAPQSG